MANRVNAINLKSVGAVDYLKPWFTDPAYALNSVMPSFIHDYTQNKYWNSSAGAGNFPFTGTRASNAMQFDSQGRLVWAPHQLCARGQDLSTGWSLSTDGTVTLSGNTAPTGAPSYNITWTAPAPTVGCTLSGQSCLANAPTTVSVYIKKINVTWARISVFSSSSSTNAFRCWVNLDTRTLGIANASGTASLISSNVVDVGNGWVRVTLTGAIPFTSTTDCSLLIASAVGDGDVTRVGNGGQIEAASVILELTSAASPQAWRPEFNTTGAVWYGARFDYDPFTGQALGLLVETTRTNDIPRGIRLRTSDLTGVGTTLATGPTYLGDWESVRITSDSTFTWHGGYPGNIPTPSASQVRSVSAIVSYVNSQFVQVYTSGNYPLDVSNTYVNVDMINGTITATGSAASHAFIRKLGNGIYHVGFTFTTGASPSGGTGAIVGLITSSTAGRQQTHTTPDLAVDVLYYCNMAGAGYTSVIPTFGTAATRAVDVINTNTGAWLDTTKGTVYGRGYRLNGNATSTFVNIGDSGGSAERNQFRINSTTASHIITVGNVVQNTSAASIGSIPLGYVEGAYRYTAGAQMMCVNGVLSGAAGNIPALPNTQSTLHIGQLNSAGEKFDGWIQEFRYYPDVSASNAQLQTLTTL